MAELNIDFEGNASNNASNQEAGNTNANAATQEDTTNLDGNDVDDVTGKDGNSQQTADNEEPNNESNSDDNNASSSTGELEAGTQIEYEGATYTVDDNGNVVDADGNVFKEAKDVKAWLEENNAEDVEDSSELNIDSIREAIGIDVTDDNGNSVEFTNNAEGVKNYVNSVISLKSSEIQQGAINKLFNDVPMLKQFVDYVQVTGSPRGFGDIPDRSGIILDKDNERQLEAVIRMAGKEFGNNTINENYINYLKDSGTLYEEAKNQLAALVGKDQAYRAEIEKQAAKQREQEQLSINEYWQGVSDAIAKRNIGGYKIPETFTKEINGQKITYTPNDFYKYVAESKEVNENGERLTGYQRDLNNLSNEEVLNRELLDAWLMFTGGSYKDLVDMAIKEDKVRKLVMKSKQPRTNRTIKINKPKGGKVDYNNIRLS